MDSNAARFSREDDNRCHERQAAAAEEPGRPQGPAPQAAGGAAAGGCHCNTQAESSHIQTLDDFPQYYLSGGIDWFEWSGLIDWCDADAFFSAVERFTRVKAECQKERKPHAIMFIRDFGTVRVSRLGMNRGGERGQHFEFKIAIPGAIIGLSPREVDASSNNKRKLPSPNFLFKQTGRNCLLFGAKEAYEMALAFISAIGGEPIELKISRGDLCLDLANLNARELHDLVSKGHFVTRASDVRPAINYLSNKITGFCAGRSPLYMTLYDKLYERLGKTDQLYNQALIDRRWYGRMPLTAARVEFQRASRSGGS